MACACKGRSRIKYLWTPPEGSSLPPMQYNSEIEAKAKVIRKGGTYAEVRP